MASKIQWTDNSWNPIRAVTSDDRVGWHCERVSPGCEHCYAETQNVARRFDKGTGLPYNRKSRDVVQMVLHEDTLVKPLRWRKPRRVFVCSMTDLFGEWVPDEMLEQVFGVMKRCSQHQFQILTKRPERMRDYMQGRVQHARQLWAKVNDTDPARAERFAVPPNVWLGVSAEDQRRLNERWEHVANTPAAVSFLSLEPLLGSINLCWCSDSDLTWDGAQPHCPLHGLNPVSWVIVGGESGPGARPCSVEWIRSILRQCQAAGVPAFVKQLGSRPLAIDTELWERDGRSWETTTPTGALVPMKMRHSHGGEMWEWPGDLRVRQWPEGVGA